MTERRTLRAEGLLCLHITSFKQDDREPDYLRIARAGSRRIARPGSKCIRHWK